jgi:hypothetical protein
MELVQYIKIAQHLVYGAPKLAGASGKPPPELRWPGMNRVRMQNSRYLTC